MVFLNENQKKRNKYLVCWAWFVGTEMCVRFRGVVSGLWLGGGRLADTDGGQLSMLGDRRALCPAESCSMGGGAQA